MSGRLISAHDVARAWRERGADPAAALELTVGQVRGLAAEVADDSGWQRLRTLVARTGDPWNADDWPLGFDPLLCCVPLCQLVDYECQRCVVGRRQEGRSCANPDTRVGRIWQLVATGDRTALAEHLAALDAHLRSLV